jgi:hypothetical protein
MFYLFDADSKVHFEEVLEFIEFCAVDHISKIFLGKFGLFFLVT